MIGNSIIHVFSSSWKLPPGDALETFGDGRILVLSHEDMRYRKSIMDIAIDTNHTIRNDGKMIMLAMEKLPNNAIKFTLGSGDVCEAYNLEEIIQAFAYHPVPGHPELIAVRVGEKDVAILKAEVLDTYVKDRSRIDAALSVAYVVSKRSMLDFLKEAKRR